ncbi:MAG: GNAT family N-acetyltransferase [Candidatus Heimdallarchaeota archaeon]
MNKNSLPEDNRPSVRFRQPLFRNKTSQEIEAESEESLADSDKTKYKFIVFKSTWDQALRFREQKLPKIIEENPILAKVTIRHLDPEKDTVNFMQTFNRAFITAPDPYRSILEEDVKKFDPSSTFVATLYGKIIGFIVLIIDPLIKKGKEVGKQGVIAGIGVDPRYRRKHIAFLLAAKAADYFDKHDVSELVCEIYHENKISYNFIRNFGFVETGVTYL